MRRIVHLLIVVVLIAGVRAWGPDAAQDRLSAGGRWTAQKLGFVKAGEIWRERVRPWFAGAQRSATDGVQRGVSTAVERADNARTDAPTWAYKGANRVTASVASAMRWILVGEAAMGTSGQSQSEPPAPAGAPSSGRAPN